MYRLSTEKRKAILGMLVEGSSMRSTARVLGCSRKTVAKLMLQAGDVAAAYHHEHVRGVKAQRIEADEIWSFCYAKEHRVMDAVAAPQEAGDVWTWTAIDPDSKLLVSWQVGRRDKTDAFEFIEDLYGRLVERVQITTDGLTHYPEAIARSFGMDVDFAQLRKVTSENKMGTVKIGRAGNPDPRFVSTSIVERMNLTIRMSQRRYTRKTNAFSKRIRNHRASFAVMALHYNFCRPHRSLANPYQRTPAMAAGLADRIYDLDWLIDMVNEATPPPNRPKRYRKG